MLNGRYEEYKWREEGKKLSEEKYVKWLRFAVNMCCGGSVKN